MKTEEKINKKKIVKVLVAVICIVVLIYIVILLINIIRKPTETFVVEQGKIYQEEFAEGYIIRDEYVIELPESENGLVAIKPESDKVARGEAIYRYCIENEQEINEKIEQIDLEIQEKLGNNDEVYSADIKSINNQIDKELDNLYECNDLQKLSQEKSDINSYLTKKMKIRAQDSSDKELKELVNKRDSYEADLKSKSKYILADNSGVISYRVDNFEDKLKSDDLSYLTKEYLENLNVETSQIISQNSRSGKIVNNFKCKIACILKSKEAKEIAIGKTVKLKFQDSEEVSAKIVDKKDQNDDETIIVFEINNKVADLIKYRKVSFDVIWWSDAGLKIPNSAIKYEGNFAYIIRNRAGLKEKIVVKVLRSNEKYSIVENYSYAELKEAGYDMSSLNNKKSISCYDQIEN